MAGSALSKPLVSADRAGDWLRGHARVSQTRTSTTAHPRLLSLLLMARTKASEIARSTKVAKERASSRRLAKRKGLSLYAYCFTYYVPCSVRSCRGLLARTVYLLNQVESARKRKCRDRELKPKAANATGRRKVGRTAASQQLQFLDLFGQLPCVHLPYNAACHR